MWCLRTWQVPRLQNLRLATGWRLQTLQQHPGVTTPLPETSIGRSQTASLLANSNTGKYREEGVLDLPAGYEHEQLQLM